MGIPLEKVEKIDKLLYNLGDIDFKDWSIGEEHTRIRAVDRDGDMFEITFTPKPK